MAKKSGPRVGLDADVTQLMQTIAVYHGGNLTAAVNYALRLAAPAILQDLQTYRTLAQPLSSVPLGVPAPISSPSSTTAAALSPPTRRSNAERLQATRL